MTTFTHLFLGDGRVTLAIREAESGEVSVGIAWCSPKDQFSRAMGRETALGPLDHSEIAKKGFDFSFKPSAKKGASIIRLKDEAISLFMNSCDKDTITVPSWAKKHKAYQMVWNRSNKTYTMNWQCDSVIVRDTTHAVYKF